MVESLARDTPQDPNTPTVIPSTYQPFNESTESAGFAGYFPKYFITAFIMASRAAGELVWPLGISLKMSLGMVS